MYNETMTVSIDRALRAATHPCIAFTGAGGKTTAMFQLARVLSQPVIVTATSHLGAWQVDQADRHLVTDIPAPIEELEHGLQGVLLVTGPLEGDRTRPVDDDLLAWLHEYCGYHAVPLLIEADGSRQKPLKAWADHEPAIPGFVGQVVQVVGLSCLGKPLQEEYVHRVEIFARLSGLHPGNPITGEAITRVLSHPDGGLKNIPTAARRVIVLNQADTAALQSAASKMVRPLLAAYDSVIIARLQDQKIYAVHERVAAVVLAAGDSSRYGKTKQLLDWHGEPFVRAVAKTALEAGCSPVVVVTGADAEQVERAVKDLPVMIVHNPAWKEGQAGSIRVGLEHLPQIRRGTDSAESGNLAVGLGRGWEGAGAAIFLLADQPQVDALVLRALIEKHAEGLYPVVAPMVMDRRANPVLFDRVTFNDLASLQGDVGGRAILHKHKVEYLPWHDDRLLLDVDTPEMYRRLLSDGNL